MDPAEAAIQESIRQARNLYARGHGSVIEILKAADRDLARRLGKHASDATFTAHSAQLYRRQIGIVTTYLEKRLAGHTHEQASKAVAASVKQTVRVAKKLEKQFTGITKPLALESQHRMDHLIHGQSASLLRRHQSSFNRYGKLMVRDFERTMRQGLLAGLTQEQMVSKLVEAGKKGGHTAQSLHGNEPGHFPKATSYVKRRYWAERIVRTEVAHAYNGAALASMYEERQHDFPDLQKKILATFDARTAADSVAVHGQVRPLDGYFTDGAGRTYQYPPARPNDREVVVPWRPHWKETEASKPPDPEVVAKAEVDAQPVQPESERREQLAQALQKAKARLAAQKAQKEQDQKATGTEPQTKDLESAERHTARAQKEAEERAAERERQQAQRRAELKAAREKALAEREAKRLENPTTNEEAVRSLEQWFEQVHHGRSDFTPLDAHRLLKEQGAAQIYRSRKAGGLSLNAVPVDTHWTKQGPHEISAHANGEFADPQIHQGFSFIKVNRRAENQTPEEAKETKARVAEVKRENAEAGFVSKDPFGYTVLHPEYRGTDATLTHEFGHAVHMSTVGEYQKIDQLVRKRHGAADRERVSGYAEENHNEYFAESYAAYRMHGPELLKVAPKAHEMVEDVLRLRGIPLRKGRK